MNFLPLFVYSQSIIKHINVYQPSDSQISYKIPGIYFQSSTTSMDNQRVTKIMFITNAPISSFPLLIYNITFFLSPRLKPVVLALILLSTCLQHLFPSSRRSVKYDPSFTSSDTIFIISHSCRDILGISQ